MTKEEPPKKYKEFGEGILAVANLCSKSKENNNINKANSSMNKPKSYRNITEAFTAGNMSTISMQERAIFITFNPKMRRSESNWKNSLGKQLWKKLNFKNKQQGQNSMSWLQIFIILLQQKLFLVCIILHIRNSNLRHLTWI
jgi:hypothetical protein